MKIKYTLPLAAVSALMLSACGGDAPQTAEVTVTETATVTAEAAVETVTATETVTASPEPAEAEVEEAEAAPPEPTTEPEPEVEVDEVEVDEVEGEIDFGEAQFSPRGNLIKEVGQPAGLMTEDGEPMVVFTLTEIDKDVQCTSRIADAPENGQFVTFTFEVETFPALAEDEWSTGTFSISQWDLTAFSLDGKRENDISGAAMWCLDSADELPSSIGPGQKAEGKVIIDTALDEGVLVYEESPFGDSGAWEWEF